MRAANPLVKAEVNPDESKVSNRLKRETPEDTSFEGSDADKAVLVATPLVRCCRGCCRLSKASLIVYGDRLANGAPVDTWWVNPRIVCCGRITTSNRIRRRCSVPERAIVERENRLLDENEPSD